MQERRRYIRAPMAAYLEMYSDKHSKVLARGFVMNLSEGGLAMEAAESVRLREDMLLRFTLMNGWSFEVAGQAIYAKGGVLTKAYGVEFKGVNSYDANRIKSFVESQIANAG